MGDANQAPAPGRADRGERGLAARLRAATGGWARSAGALFAALGFWLAVVLPVAYLPLLHPGLPRRLRLGGLGGLVVVHAVALGVGRTHRRRVEGGRD